MAKNGASKASPRRGPRPIAGTPPEFLPTETPEQLVAEVARAVDAGDRPGLIAATRKLRELHHPGELNSESTARMLAKALAWAVQRGDWDAAWSAAWELERVADGAGREEAGLPSSAEIAAVVRERSRRRNTVDLTARNASAQVGRLLLRRVSPFMPNGIEAPGRTQRERAHNRWAQVATRLVLITSQLPPLWKHAEAAFTHEELEDLDRVVELVTRKLADRDPESTQSAVSLGLSVLGVPLADRKALFEAAAKSRRRSGSPRR